MRPPVLAWPEVRECGHAKAGDGGGVVHGGCAAGADVCRRAVCSGGQRGMGAEGGSAGAASGGGRRAWLGRMPRAWQSGRRTRPRRGSAASSVASSGSARKWRSWEAPEAVCGTRRSSQALRRGKGSGGERRSRPGRGLEGRYGVVAAWVKRLERRRRRDQIRTISGPASPPSPTRRATAWHRPSMMRAKWSAREREAVRVTNRCRTWMAGGGQAGFAIVGAPREVEILERARGIEPL